MQALAVGLSAPAAAGVWVACSTSPDSTSDAGSADDATATDQAAEAPSGFGTGGSTIDSHVDWCEAGPPQALATGSCYNYFYVPCGLPPGDYPTVSEAGKPSINRCDQICIDAAHYDCQLLDDAAINILLHGDGGGDTGTSPDEAGSGDSSADAGPNMSSNPGVYVVCDCVAGGRRPRGLAPCRTSARNSLGDHFSAVAHLEAASVPAFQRLATELTALDAPARLLALVARAVRDEERHTRMMRNLAAQFGSDVPRVLVRPFRTRGVEAVARENAVEGCVRELYGALVATWQAEHAVEPTIRATMRRIAVDETNHAYLSLEVARFLERHLDSAARARVRRAQQRAIRQLSREAARTPSAELVVQAGLPSPTEAQRLLRGLAARVWSRGPAAKDTQPLAGRRRSPARRAARGTV